MALGRLVKAGSVGGVGRDPTSPGAVGCDEHEEAHAEQRPAHVVIADPHGAWTQECECFEVHRSRITESYFSTNFKISVFLNISADFYQLLHCKSPPLPGALPPKGGGRGGGDVTGIRG